MRQPIDLVGGFYTDESLPWSVQDTVNYLPVSAEASGTRTPTKLVDAPGLRPFQAIGNTDGDPTAGAPIRGIHDVEGRLFVVSGQMLYEIGQSGVAIPRGAIPGVGRVSMAHNQRGHGHELLVVNGSGGYVYNTATDNFTIVTDPGYPGAGVADFLDGYLMQVEPFGRFLFHSDLADALEYNTLDRFEAETQPDRVVGMIVNHQEVWAFGDRTIDVFGNAGTAQGTFQNKGVSISRGCIAKWSPAIIDNGVAWLGDDRVVYHARGYDPARISTRAIEVALSECSLADIRNAFSFVWADRGHSVYYLTVPNGLTFGYDFSTGLWHRRASWHPELDIGGRWCLSDLVRSNGRWVGGDFRDGRLYTLDWDYMLEGCDPLIRERVSPVAHVDGRRFSVDSVELLYDTGGSGTACTPFPVQPTGPSIEGSAPDGSMGVTYVGYSYVVTAGSAPISSIEIVSGELPPGLSFNSGEIDKGTPGRLGDYSFVVRVTDSNGLYAQISDSIKVVAVSFATTRGRNGILVPSPTGEVWSGSIDSGLNAACYLLKCAGGNVYCFGQMKGRVSQDQGQSWADVIYSGEFPNKQPTSIVYSNEVWILTFQSGGVVGRSEDGVTFIPIPVPEGSGLLCSAAIDDTFILGGGWGRILRSVDRGNTWQRHDLRFSTTSSIDLIYAQGDAFIAQAYVSSPGPTSHMYVSEGDGSDGSWEERAEPEASAFGVRRMISSSDSIVYIALRSGGYFSSISSDLAESFVEGGYLSHGVASPDQVNNITWNGERFITGVSSYINISVDGHEWDMATNPTATETWYVASLGEWPDA